MARLALLPGFPLPKNALRIELPPLAEHVGVTGDHLRDVPADDRGGRGASLPLMTHGEEGHEEEQIAQLLRERIAIPGRNRIGNLVRFLYDVRRQGRGRLLAIPRAAVRPREVADEIEQSGGRFGENRPVVRSRGEGRCVVHRPSLGASIAQVHAAPLAPARHV